jgi:hypothetical protein
VSFLRQVGDLGPGQRLRRVGDLESGLLEQRVVHEEREVRRPVERHAVALAVEDVQLRGVEGALVRDADLLERLGEVHELALADERADGGASVRKRSAGHRRPAAP